MATSTPQGVDLLEDDQAVQSQYTPEASAHNVQDSQHLGFPTDEDLVRRHEAGQRPVVAAHRRRYARNHTESAVHEVEEKHLDEGGAAIVNAALVEAHVPAKPGARQAGDEINDAQQPLAQARGPGKEQVCTRAGELKEKTQRQAEEGAV